MGQAGPAGAALAKANNGMRTDKLAILFLFVLAIAGTIAFRLLRKIDGSVGAGNRPIKPSAASEFRGICLQLHNSDPDHPHEQFIDEIARTGANTVALVVNAYQENGESTSIFIEARKTPPNARMKKLVRHARNRGLRVVLMPILLLENPREGDWRGTIRPTSWDDWWEDYTNYIMHYARLAQAAEADLFMVGSELVSTETQTRRWRTLIRRVRGAYKGRLCYSANWDHYDVIKWWDDLDVIGMTTYYDLTGGKKPTLENILAAWKPIKKRILEWQATINRPIIFTEVGWPNQVTAAQFPWDYTRSPEPENADPAQQAACFEAFFRTWFLENQVTGYLIWEWRNSPSEKGGLKDTSYFPGGKPAMAIIRRYYALPGPGLSTLPATQPAPPTRPVQPSSAAAKDEPAREPPGKPIFDPGL